jgi:12-oxophytodienoic acid reductase
MRLPSNDSAAFNHLQMCSPHCRAIGTIPQPITAEYYSQRASEGGFMITEGTVISPQGHGYPHTPGIYLDEQASSQRAWADGERGEGRLTFSSLARADFFLLFR